MVKGAHPALCRCSESARERYARRLSAPLLDRFDIAIRIDRPHVDELVGGASSEPTSVVAARVATARSRAPERGVNLNSELEGSVLESRVPMSRGAARLVEREVRSGALSARGLHRVHRLARTVADLDGADGVVEEAHVREALLLRCRRELLLGTEPR